MWRCGSGVLWAACLLLVSCSDSEPDEGQGGAGAAAASGTSGAGQGGASGTGGDPASGSCMDREQRAASAVADAVDAADLSCSGSSDCEFISIDTACHATCGALVSTQGRAAVEAVISAQNATTCTNFEDGGCMRVIPPCLPALGFDCVAGRCAWLEGPSADAGATRDDAGAGADGGSGVQGCVDREVAWGPEGGFVAFQQRSVLAPCRDYRVERSSPGGGPAEEQCSNEVPASADVTADDIDAALAHADVQAALAAAPVLYGVDNRPADGQVFRIELGGATIDVGEPCAGGSGCAAIPAGVAALKTALEALQNQQRGVTPNCLGTE